MRLANKTAIITGAAQGMGGTITENLARQGADLVLAARTLEPLEEMAEKVRAMGRRAEIVPTDVTEEVQVVHLIERSREFFDGRIDILVSAGGCDRPN